MTAPTRTPMIVVDAGKLRTFRHGAGLSLTALANRAGVSYPAVQRMEQGGERGGCRPHTLASVADALGVTPAALLPGGQQHHTPCPTCGQPSPHPLTASGQAGTS